MDQKTAESLLKQVRQEKQALEGETRLDGLSGLASDPASIGSKFKGLFSSKPDQYSRLADDLRADANKKVQHGAANSVIRAMLLAGGAGAALRGVSGLQRLFSGSAKPVPSRTVDMPVMYPASRGEEEREDDEKQARDPKATSPYGLDWYIPSMVLGAPLAAYGGWKGVDAVLDTQRRKKTEEDLDAVKAKYQKALLDSYKTATDNGAAEPEDILGDIFDRHYKRAEEEGFLSGFVNRHFPNMPGIAKGLGATYAIPAAAGGYLVVDSIMRKRSKRALLEKAMRERARRQAQLQPAELYAIPTPKEDSEEARR
jgi:hypothetical protein